MKIDLKNNLDRKSRKSLECWWPKLINKHKYFIPKSIEDLSQAHGELKINDVPHVFLQDTAELIEKFSLIIFNNPTVNPLFSKDTIYKSILSEISKAYGKANNKFDDVLSPISSAINDKFDFYTFYFPIFGLQLKTTEKFSIENVSIVNFDDNLCLKILDRSISKDDETWFHRAQEYLKENFVNKSVIIVPAHGDREVAENKARKKANVFINYIRFVICLLAHERINENLLKISLEFSWPSKNDSFFCETEKTQSFFLQMTEGEDLFKTLNLLRNV